MKKLFFVIAAFLVSSVAISGDVVGKIQVVTPHTHPGWNGVMIQMAEGEIVDPDCGNGTWALIRVQSELDKMLVSVVLAAQTTQQMVRVFTSECSVPPATLGTLPVVQAIDLGLRQ